MPVVPTIQAIEESSSQEITRPATPVHLEAKGARGVTVTPVDPRLPKIMLQRPTPSPTDGPAPTTGLGFMIPAPPPSPSPQPHVNTGSVSPHGSPPLGVVPIAVPHVEDAALQKFFHDIAEQLQLIGSASPRSSIAMDSPMASPALSQGGSTALETPMPTPGPLDGPILQGAQANMPVKSRPPIPPRAQSDAPVPSPKPDLATQKRRSYLGDATSRDNTMQQTNSTTQRHSIQLTGEKVRKSIAPTKTDSKRKSKRKRRSVFQRANPQLLLLISPQR